MPTDLLEKPRLPRSAVRHRRVMPDAVSTQVQTRRASRTRQKPKPYTPDDVTVPVSALTPQPSARGTWLIYLVLGMLAAMALLWVGETLWNYGNTVSDDLRYGRPRTTNVDKFVGHETNSSIPSHFTALNLSGQVYIIEIPGGSPNTSRLLVGPHLVGPSAELAPVTLSFVGDTHHPDLLVQVASIQILFHNTGTTYAPAS